ncbi:cell surface protein [Carnobacterium divergens]|uniref:WxL domain-containing protein n=1 Tax=Carnobacterium divergens TaxID=2748 RepID=UPI0010723C9A|nr:WxL domain-containing protein [Carnobacterium divergens]TFI65608.1 cell surface protein [Carnobacterium divergens]TFI65671.1 cell surface protein [Carnobacterium divergens]TFI80557.1 cell surface protein [Carnobacterium divergens]TFJ06492.1 cell surface protein [Carnobacterium divergens]TFJ11821.1 cell surface protein [Carnobacterium divergens]
MKSLKLATVGTVLFSTLLLSGVGHVSAAPGPIPANRDTNAQVKFIEDESPTDPTDPTDPDPTDPVKPVDPTDPEKPVEPGTNGPLSLDYASSLDFGEQLISNKTQSYFAKPQFLRGSDGKIDTENPIPNYAQVTDKRGGEKGWALSVKQNGQFKSVKESRELVGAEITFKNGEVASASSSKAPSAVKKSFSLKADGTGVAENVMAASKGEGFGTWVYRSGDVSTMAESIELSVPGATVKDADTYKTTLTWTLTDVPDNTVPETPGE